MSFSTQYPDFAAIEDQIRHARAERAVYIATLLSDVIVNVINGTRRIGGAWLEKVLDTWNRGLAAERDQRAVEADIFVKRWVH